MTDEVLCMSCGDYSDASEVDNCVGCSEPVCWYCVDKAGFCPACSKENDE